MLSINAFQGSVGSFRNYNCGLGTYNLCSHHAPSLTPNQIRRSINTIIQTPHPTTPTALHAFRGSDYNSNNNFGEDDDDDVDEDDEPPKLDTSPQEFLYRMQQRESQNKSSDSTSDDSSTTNDDSILSAPSYGPGRGRSTPQIRSAFGAKKKSSSLSNNIKRGAKGGNDTTNKDMTTVHVCTNCGAEYIQWRGQCSTCLEWNTIQEYRARRKPSSSSGSGNSKMKPIFGKGKFSQKNNNSWLDGINDYSYNSGGGSSSGSGGGPVRVTDVYQEILSDTDDESLDDFQNGNNRERRTLVPDDSELNTVLGGGIMPGSICLVGGDPGNLCYLFCF